MLTLENDSHFNELKKDFTNAESLDWFSFSSVIDIMNKERAPDLFFYGFRRHRGQKSSLNEKLINTGKTTVLLYPVGPVKK